MRQISTIAHRSDGKPQNLCKDFKLFLRANPIRVRGQQRDLRASKAQDTASCEFGHHRCLADTRWADKGVDATLVDGANHIERLQVGFEALLHPPHCIVDVGLLGHLRDHFACHPRRKSGCEHQFQQFCASWAVGRHRRCDGMRHVGLQ